MAPIQASLRMLLFMTVLTGLAYPAAVTCVSQLFFPAQAAGSWIRRGDKIVGSRHLAQEFKGPGYFWPRPSATGYSALPSGGSNLGPTSTDLKKQFDQRLTTLEASHPGAGRPPQDLLFASASGLDPDISPQAALYQIQRVAGQRGLSVEQVTAMVERRIQDRQLGWLGAPRINVLELNLALDEMQKGPRP